jgi:hypothetical protein
MFSRPRSFGRLHDDLEPLALLRPGLGLGGEQDLHPELGEAAVDGRDQVLLDDGQQRVGELDDRHLRPQFGEERADLEPDDAAADDHQRRRRLGEVQGFLRAEDVLAVDDEAGDREGFRAGGHDGLVELHGLAGPVGLRDDGGVGASELGRADDVLALVALHQHADVLHEPADHLVLPGHDLSPVERVFGVVEAGVLGLLGLVGVPRGRDEGLGRDAAVVEALAAELVSVHDDGAFAELAELDGGDVAAGSAADDEDVGFEGHEGSPREGCAGSRAGRRGCS